MKVLNVLIPLCVVFSVAGHASSQNRDQLGSCEQALSSEAKKSAKSQFEVVPSDRVPGEAQAFTEYARELTEPGGLLDQLEIDMTGQIVQFVPGRELNAITSGSAGGYPIAHYVDGAEVIKSLQQKGGFALEVVYPGPDFQHGFYRDDNQKDQQFSIIDHVVGHNHFAKFSTFDHYRVAQGMLATRKLDDLLQGLYRKFNKDEVQRFYLWSLTLTRLIDWYTPHYQPSSEFEPKFELSKTDPLNRTKPRILRHPRSPTENILPAFAANLAPNEPSWKREILELIHDSMAFRPALVHTQIMNEGWASIMQEIIPPYTKNHNHFAYWLNASQVMQTEDRPNLRDPYSLGVFCWRRLREIFNERPEIKGLANLDRDRAFIQYAQNEVISRMDDEQFLRLAMDQVFIDRYKLAVVRRASEEEQDERLEQPQTQEPVAQWIVVSKNKDKVVQAVIDKVIKPKYNLNPRVKLMDFNRPNSGEVELVLNDEVANQLALEKSTLAPSLFALAQTIGKPVSLDAQIYLDQLVRIRMVVAPAGEVKVYQVLEAIKPLPLQIPDAQSHPPEKLNEELTQAFGESLKSYLDDLYLDDEEGLNELKKSSPQLREIEKQILAKWVDDVNYGGLMVHSPNAAGAIQEYHSALERRLMAAMERAAKQKGGLALVNGSMRVRALPSEVHLQFDMQHAQGILEATPGAPVDSVRVSPRSPFGDYAGGGGTVGGVDGQAGDRFWGPGNPQGGGGQPVKPGEDPNDLSWVEIPQDLYARFLGERVKLPNLTSKPGLSRVRKTKPGGRINRRTGQALATEIMQNAFKRGAGEVLAEGGDPLEDVEHTFGTGFGALQPRDWVVKSSKPTKKPEVRAVVTFVLDASGSVGPFLEEFKRFVNDMEILISSNYQGFDFRYVVFDTEAHVMKNKKDFFGVDLGDGTEYVKGLEKTMKLFEDEYPRAGWDRFTFLLGDMGDFSPEKASAKIKDMLEETEYFGVVAGIAYPEYADGWPLLTFAKAESQSNERLGLTIINPSEGYQFKNMREVLKNKDDE